jgi:hypothetical protein
MQQEFAARLQQTICQKKHLHAKIILAAHLPQIVREKYAAGVCCKVAKNCVSEKKKCIRKVYLLHTCSKLCAITM